MRKPFILYRRNTGRKRVYHIGFWDVKRGDYSIRRSADTIINDLQVWGKYSPTSKADVEALAWLYINNGMVHIKMQKQGTDALEFFEEFWNPESKYIKRKAAREEALSVAYINANQGIIKNHVKPFFEKLTPKERQLENLNTETFEECFTYIFDKTKSARRVNVARQAMSVALEYALKAKMIMDNPVKRVEKYPEKKSDKGILSITEAKKFFNPEIWENKVIMAINLLAASSGARLGECRALNPVNIFRLDIDDESIPCIDIVPEVGNWVDEEGYKDPKWGSARVVPIPETVYDLCMELVEENPWKNQFVFYSNSFKNRPVQKKEIGDAFNEICTKIEIKDRKERKLTFHSWRHWYDTLIAGEVPGEVRRRLTGHADEKMDKRYIHFTDEHRKILSVMGNKIFDSDYSENA